MSTKSAKHAKIASLADDLINYVLENERGDFAEWFADDGWDDKAVCKALGVKEISEEFANTIAITSMRDESHNMLECLAYYTDGEHVFAAAVKLAVASGNMPVPKLNKRALRQIQRDHDD